MIERSDCNHGASKKVAREDLHLSLACELLVCHFELSSQCHECTLIGMMVGDRREVP